MEKSVKTEQEAQGCCAELRKKHDLVLSWNSVTGVDVACVKSSDPKLFFLFSPPL